MDIPNIEQWMQCSRPRDSPAFLHSLHFLASLPLLLVMRLYSGQKFRYIQDLPQSCAAPMLGAISGLRGSS
jgi:hypothetical protein